MRKLITAVAMSLLSTVVLAEPSVTQGEVTKIDPAQNKLTLKHGPIKNLDMDAMTMVFAVGDPAIIKSVKVGDKVAFEADRVNGRITVIKLQKAN